MRIVIYIIRFLLALLFIYVAIDKIINPAIPQDEIGINTEFITFYTLLLESNFIYFVCFCEFLCGFLLLFKYACYTNVTLGIYGTNLFPCYR